MELFPQELRTRLPPLYPRKASRIQPFTFAFSLRTRTGPWYATEGSPGDDDFIFFGYVIGFEKEWGYFALSELASSRGPMGLPIERDLYFEPQPFSQVMAR